MKVGSAYPGILVPPTIVTLAAVGDAVNNEPDFVTKLLNPVGNEKPILGVPASPLPPSVTETEPTAWSLLIFIPPKIFAVGVFTKAEFAAPIIYWNHTAVAAALAPAPTTEVLIITGIVAVVGSAVELFK